VSRWYVLFDKQTGKNPSIENVPAEFRSDSVNIGYTCREWCVPPEIHV